MKSFRWLTLVAALLITACEVLVLRNQVAHVPQPQVNVAVAADGENSTFAPGV
jgi:hypothetical protein